MNFAQSIDRYLTEQPDNGYTTYVEQVYEWLFQISEIDGDLVPDSWLDYLCVKGYTPEGAAQLIAKAFAKRPYEHPMNFQPLEI